MRSPTLPPPAVATGDPIAGDAAAAASAFIGEYGTELAHDCVQIHGGIGVTFEHDLHLFLRRIVANRSTYGSPVELRRGLADLLEQRQSGGVGVSAPDIEPVEEFRARARAWIRGNLPPSKLSDEIGQLRPRTHRR